MCLYQGGFFQGMYLSVSLKFLHAQCLPDVCHCGSMPRVNHDGMRLPGGDTRGPCWEPALQSAREMVLLPSWAGDGAGSLDAAFENK